MRPWNESFLFSPFLSILRKRKICLRRGGTRSSRIFYIRLAQRMADGGHTIGEEDGVGYRQETERSKSSLSCFSSLKRKTFFCPLLQRKEITALCRRNP